MRSQQKGKKEKQRVFMAPADFPGHIPQGRKRTFHSQAAESDWGGDRGEVI